MKKQVLLIQARAARDPMAAHEVSCVCMRLGSRPVEVVTQNAFLSESNASWLKGIDAVILGGAGDFSVHDPRSASWVTPLRRFIETLLVQEIPSFAVCFGHQLLR